MSLIQLDRSQIQDGEIVASHLATAAKTAVLASKNLIELIASTDLTNPNAATSTISGFPETTEFPFSSVAGVIGDGSSLGIPVLLETAAGNSGQSHGFNTNSSKVWGGQAPFYAAQVFDLNGAEVTDPDNGGNKVWAVITATARTTAGTYTIRFFSDEWGPSGEVVCSNPYTMAAGYFLAYPKVVNLSTMSLGALRSDTVKLSKTAAGVSAGSIGTAELADGAVTADKIAAGAVGSSEIADNAVGTDEIADSAVTEAKILDSSITSAKINNGAVTEGKIADGAVATAKIADSAVTEGKIADAVLNRDVEFLAVDPSYGGVIMASDTSAEGKVSALASPGMAVRVQTGGVAYGPTGKRITIPTSANLAISAADGTDTRYDAVVCNASGALAVRAGTPDASPVLPTLTSGDVFLAAVKIAANVTEITGSDVFDHRRGVGARRKSKVWEGSTATDYDLPRRVRGEDVDAYRNGANILKADSPATADEYTITDPVESNGSRVSLGAAPSSCIVRIAYMG